MIVRLNLTKSAYSVAVQSQDAVHVLHDQAGICAGGGRPRLSEPPGLSGGVVAGLSCLLSVTFSNLEIDAMHMKFWGMLSKGMAVLAPFKGVKDANLTLELLAMY
jgi:hypothetical protein